MPEQMNVALPSAPQAEASLLGTMMLYPNAARTAIEEGLNEDDFFIEPNRLIFLAIEQLYQEGIPIDITAVSTRLKDLNTIDHVGGFTYLSDLIQTAVTSYNTKNYVNLVREKAIMRKLIEISQDITMKGLNGQPDLDEYLDFAESSILSISRNRKTTDFKTSPELMTAVLEDIHKMSENHSAVTGIKTGYNDLDRITHGFQRGDFVVLAARPSMGKTAVALNLALNVARFQQDQAVAIFSLEMGAEQLATRLLTAHSKVAGDKIKTGYLNSNEWNLVNEAATELKMLNIYIDDTPGLKVPEIFSKCRKLASDKKLSMILIDYIQLIQGSSKGANVNRQQEVSDISRSLKALAREMDVPVIALSQLSRGVEQRPDKHPMLSDLRESGAIEQDADIVMMLYRDSYYNKEVKETVEEQGTEELEINIAKHRNGATRSISVAFEAKTNLVLPYAREMEG